jgi:hypothetical protein
MASKMIYLAKRNPSTTHEQFLENWKGHSAKTAPFPRIREHILQVAQCSRIQDDSILPEASQEYDGLNLLTMRGLVNALELWDDPDARTVMRADELRVFSTYAKDFTLFAEDSVLIDGPMRGTVVVQFLRRRADVDRESFVKAWTGKQARSLMSTDMFNARVRRFVHNHVILDAPPGYEYDGIAELWFDAIDDVRSLFDNAQFRTNFFAGAEPFCDVTRSVLLLTRVNLARPPIADLKLF